MSHGESKEPSPAIVLYSYPIEITLQIVLFPIFPEKAPFLAKNAQTTLCLKGRDIYFD